MNEREGEKICTLLATFVLAKSMLSFDPELPDRSCKTNKGIEDFLLY
jgi:hypothetical protein